MTLIGQVVFFFYVIARKPQARKADTKAFRQNGKKSEFFLNVSKFETFARNLFHQMRLQVVMYGRRDSIPLYIEISCVCASENVPTRIFWSVRLRNPHVRIRNIRHLRSDMTRRQNNRYVTKLSRDKDNSL